MCIYINIYSFIFILYKNTSTHLFSFYIYVAHLFSFYINICSFIFILIGSDGIGSTASEGAEDSYETLKELWVLLGVSCCRKAARLVLGTYGVV